MKLNSTKLVVLFASLEGCLADVRAAITTIRALNDHNETGQMSLYGLDLLLHELLDARDDPQTAPGWLGAACTDCFALRAAVKQHIIAQLRPRYTVRLGDIRQRTQRAVSTRPPEVAALLRTRAA